jgi:hypothetical protein
MGNLLKRVLTWTQGRTTAFCTAFFVSGNVFAWYGKLTLVYVSFMGTLLGAVLGHSVKEDYFKKPDGNGNCDNAGGADATTNKQ